jgi:hypothetical protein
MKMNKEELRNWFKDKEIRTWRRALFLLYREGEMSNLVLAAILGADQRSVRRTLSKLQLGSKPMVILKNHKWLITSWGIESVEYGQKNGKYPVISRGR